MNCNAAMSRTSLPQFKPKKKNLHSISKFYRKGRLPRAIAFWQGLGFRGIENFFKLRCLYSNSVVP